jgi:hypothetical protein
MNRLKWGLGLAVLVVTIAGTGAVAHAQRFTNNTAKEDVINGSLYSAGQKVTIKGVVNGDVFCTGQIVEIEATVKGDVICAGQDVTVAGTVEGDVRLAGQRVSVSAKIAGSATTLSDELSIDAPATIGRDLTALGNSLNVKGSIGRDTLLNGTVGVVNGTIKRDVQFNGTTIELKKDARVGGSLTYTSRNDIKKTDGAVVTGVTEHREPSQGNKNHGFNIAWFVLALVALTLASLVIALIAPRTLQGLSDSIGTTWIKPMLIGLLASIVLPFLTVMLLVTIVGVPVSAMLIFIWIGLMLFSGPVAGYYVGSRILPKQKNVLVRTIAGTALLVTLSFVPFIGFLIVLGAYWLGSGAILLLAKRRLGKPNYLAE